MDQETTDARDAANAPDEPTRRPEAPPYGRRPLEPTPLWAWFVLAGIVIAGFLVRVPGLGGPIVGYHAFNEAYYVSNAVRDLHLSPLSPWLTLALNPPLYTSLLSGVMWVFGPTILTGRVLSVVATLGTAVAVFFLGRRLYGTTAGLGAAVVMALAPGSALVGRNIQIEPVLGLLITLTTLAWVIAMDEGSIRWSAGAGIFAGLAWLAKMQGVVIVPALALAEVIRTRSLRRLLARGPLTALIAFLVVGLPWQLWNLLQPSRAMVLGVRASESGWPDLRFFDMLLYREWVGFLSPGLAVVVVAGLLLLAWRHRPADVLVLLLVLFNIVFYFVYHLHSYYLYSAVPFVALCAGAVLEPLELRRPRVAIAAVCVAALVLTPFALTEVVGKKLGYWGSDQVVTAAVAAGVDPANSALAVGPSFLDTWGPVLEFYGKGMQAVARPLRPGDVLRPGERLISLDPQPRPASADVKPLIRLTDTHVMPVFFGYAVDQSHDALFYFAIDQPHLQKVGPWWTFGVTQRTVPMDLWASLISPAWTERIRAEAASATAAPSPAP